MAIVVVKLAGKGIQFEMRDMRIWLDAKGIQPLAFTYDPADAVASVEFSLANDAEAFNREFGDRPISLNTSAAAPTSRALTPQSGA